LQAELPECQSSEAEILELSKIKELYTVEEKSIQYEQKVGVYHHRKISGVFRSIQFEA